MKASVIVVCILLIAVTTSGCCCFGGFVRSSGDDGHDFTVDVTDTPPDQNLPLPTIPSTSGGLFGDEPIIGEWEVDSQSDSIEQNKHAHMYDDFVLFKADGTFYHEVQLINGGNAYREYGSWEYVNTTTYNEYDIINYRIAYKKYQDGSLVDTPDSAIVKYAKNSITDECLVSYGFYSYTED